MKIEFINNTSFKARDIKVGDKIPFGGSILRDTMDIYIEVDRVDKIQKGIDKLNKRLAEKTDSDKLEWKNWLNQVGTDIDPTLFMNLFLFTQMSESLFSDSKQTNDYDKIKIARDGFKLSLSLDNNMFSCTEFSLIAQMYLQQAGIDSEYVAGEVLWKKDYDFGEAHAFIKIYHDKKEYIFDPANSIIAADGNKFPKISEIRMSKYEEKEFYRKLKETKRKVAFFKTIDILSGEEIYYGFGDNTSIVSENIDHKIKILRIGGIKLLGNKRKSNSIRAIESYPHR